MQIIEQSHEILTDISADKIMKNIERAGRTCYKSEALITEDSANKFVNMICNEVKHHSVLEHESFSVRFITNRAMTHEIVRHRLMSPSEQSTRYVDQCMDKHGGHSTYILHPFVSTAALGTYESKDIRSLSRELNMLELFGADAIWVESMFNSELTYKELRGLGWSPEHARGVLPNDLKTEIVVTANLREWMHILTLRTSVKAHPQMRALMNPLLRELQDKLPIIFGGINIQE